MSDPEVTIYLTQDVNDTFKETLLQKNIRGLKKKMTIKNT
jgi:hypothetical protein